MSKIKVNTSVGHIAISQARSLAKKAKQIAKSNDNNPCLEETLNFLVIAGLSVELYLKAFMIVARGGEVTKGHDLDKLYRQFPDSFKRSISKHYDENKLKEKSVCIIGMLISKEQPAQPDENRKLEGVYSDFDSAMKSIKMSFVKARYFFEKVGNDYTFVEYPSGQVMAIIQALESNFVKFESGGFKGAMSN
jgi:HEPN domain-containing protein